MITNLGVFDKYLVDSLEKTEKLCRELHSASSDKKPMLLTQCEKALKEAHTMKSSYLMEMSQLKDKTAYRINLESYEERLDRMKQDFKNQKEAYERSMLLPAGSRREGAASAGGTGADEIFGEIHNVQGKTSASLNRSAVRMGEALQMAKDTAADLEAQGKQIEDISEGIRGMDDEIRKANQHLTSIVRKIATDKVVLCFGMILLTLVIAVIILVATGTIDTVTPHPPPG